MERKVGDTFDFEGHKIKVVKSDKGCMADCNIMLYCFFYHMNCSIDKIHELCGECCRVDRPENDDEVCFIKV